MHRSSLKLYTQFLELQILVIHLSYLRADFARTYSLFYL